MENETEFQQLLDSMDPFRARLLTTLQRIHTDGVVVTFLKNELYVQWLKSFNGYFADDAQLNEEIDQDSISSAESEGQNVTSSSEGSNPDDKDTISSAESEGQNVISSSESSKSDDDQDNIESDDSAQYGYADDDYQNLMDENIFSSSGDNTESTETSGHEDSSSDFSDGLEEEDLDDDFFAHWEPYPAGEIEITRSDFRIALMELEMVSFYLSSLN